MVQALRTYQYANGNELRIQLPDNMVGKQVEIIVMPVKDADEHKVEEPQVSYRGALNRHKSIQEIDEQIKQMRAEWEQDI